MPSAKAIASAATSNVRLVPSRSTRDAKGRSTLGGRYSWRGDGR
jgi:hypothetical protein